MPTYTDTPCGRCIQRAEEALGPLTEEQKVDLLLDNFMALADSDEAREMVRWVTVDAEVADAEARMEMEPEPIISWGWSDDDQPEMEPMPK